MRQNTSHTGPSEKTEKNATFGASAQSRLNSALSVVLMIFLGLAPIPLGSNRPVFWALTGITLATIALVYMILMVLKKYRLRQSAAQFLSLLLPFILLLAFIALQFFPLGSWVSPINISIGDTIVSSSTMSLTPGMSFLSLIQFASYGLLFFLLLQAAHNTERAHRMLITLFVIFVIYAAYALFALTQLGDPILFIEKWAYQGSATATFVNRNSFATFLSFGMILGTVFTSTSLLPNCEDAGHKKNLPVAMLYFLGFLIIFAALVATQSRMGFAAGFVGSLVAFFLVFSKAPNAKRWIWPALLFGILGTITLFFLYGGALLERIGSVETDLDVRLALYEQVMAMIANRPWTGYGAGSFELAFPLFHQLPVSPDVVWDKAHNTYLTLWVELGIIFGSIPILLVFFIGLKTFKIFRSTKIRWVHATISLGVITTASIHSLVDFSLEIQAVALLFVAFLAIGMAGPNRSGLIKHEN